MTSVYFTETFITVPFHDVDSMHIVWHGHYTKYFEVARCEFLNSIGYNYQKMADSGFSWPVIDMRIKYVKPAHFDQKICVRCNLREWEYRLKVDYLISDAVTGERLTKGYTVQMPVSLETKEMSYDALQLFSAQLTKKLGYTPKEEAPKEAAPSQDAN